MKTQFTVHAARWHRVNPNDAATLARYEMPPQLFTTGAAAVSLACALVRLFDMRADVSVFESIRRAHCERVTCTDAARLWHVEITRRAIAPKVRTRRKARKLPDVPASFPVRVLSAEEARNNPNACTCGACGRSWDDSISTAYTPAPGARCPFEFHHA